jgi:hypothetical protein
MFMHINSNRNRVKFCLDTHCIDDITDLAVVGGSQASGCVPSRCCVVTSVGWARASILSAGVVTLHDVIEGSGVLGVDGVQQWVNETEHWLVVLQAVSVQVGNQAGELQGIL